MKTTRASTSRTVSARSASPRATPTVVSASRPARIKNNLTVRGIEVKEYLWGYGSGIAAATIAAYGDVVLAEHTLPFNEADVTYFPPLYIQTVAHLCFFPLNITADAASLCLVYVSDLCLPGRHRCHCASIRMATPESFATPMASRAAL